MKYFDELYVGKVKDCIKEVIKRYRYQKPILIYDSHIDVEDILDATIGGVMRITITKEPTYDVLNQVVGRVREGYLRRKWDVLIVVGGGSMLDIGKACAVMLTNEGEALRYKGFDKLEYPGLPTILIPTTLTGSDATDNASFVDDEVKMKMGINGKYMRATHVIHDETLLPEKSTRVWASTLMDAYTHAYESLWSRNATDFTRTLSMKAIEYLDKGRYQLGAYLAGKALCNSGSGLAGAMSYVLGVHWGIPHGIAGAIFLVDEARENGDMQAAEKIERLLSELRISKNLKDYGIEEDKLQQLAEHLHIKSIIRGHYGRLGDSGEKREAENRGNLRQKPRGRVRARV